MVKLLLEGGAEVEHQNENGHTPLMEAASCGHVGEEGGRKGEGDGDGDGDRERDGERDKARE